jgi:hypothetical protein
MELFIGILGYGIILAVIGVLLFLVGRLLADALSALTDNDD